MNIYSAQRRPVAASAASQALITHSSTHWTADTELPCQFKFLTQGIC